MYRLLIDEKTVSIKHPV